MMPTLTNGEMIRRGITPCETNDETGGLSKTKEPFHARALVTVGSMKTNLRHVCSECAAVFHRHQQQRAGILWE
jgi:hypothetical protein